MDIKKSIEYTKICQEYIQKNPDTKKIQNIQEIYPILIQCINAHDALYHKEGKPIISDKAYDELFAYCKHIEKQFPGSIDPQSPTQRLTQQYEKIDTFVQAQHTAPLLSLENSYNAKDLEEFDGFIQRQLTKSGTEYITEHETTYILQPKFDGISIELIYIDGKLDAAITRGDGYIGDDVTHNIRTIKNIPHTLTDTHPPKKLSVRGEILMPKSMRKEINDIREADGLDTFANTRNATAGSIKSLDANIVAERGLVCYIYDMLAIQKTQSDPIAYVHEKNEGHTFTTYEQIHAYIHRVGLPVFDREKTVNSIQDVIQYCTNPKTEEELLSSDIEFDGIVIKLNNLEKRAAIGSTQHHPRRGMAYKFPAQQAATQILSIDFQVGRTGVITPVANLAPTELAGVCISRVSLHNFDFITEKDIHPNDWIWLQRSGEVIPYVVGVIKERREKNTQNTTVQIPTHCPSCNTTLVQKEAFRYCTHETCPAKLQEQCLHFVSKNCMDIEGVGQSIIELLVQQKILTDITDIYKLTHIETQVLVKSLPGCGTKKIENIVAALEKSKKNELRRIINAIGIPHIGKKMAQSIQNEIQKKATEEQKQEAGYRYILQYLTNEEFLRNIYGVGDSMIQSSIQYAQTHAYILQKLSNHGVQFLLGTEKKQTGHGKRSDFHFCITGTFPISRDAIIHLFEEQGAIADTQPTKKTNAMLIGAEPGSKKEKAEQLGIPIYEGREKICTEFPFCKNSENKKIKESKPIIQQQSLFM